MMSGGHLYSADDFFRRTAMLEFISEKESTWEFLRRTELPVFIYGMGDGAVKIMRVFDQYGIPLAGIFASDEFVRGHSFCGHLVHKLSQIERLVEDFVIVLAFGAGYRSLYDRINDIAKRHILLAPDVPVVGEGLFTYDYCMENAAKIQRVYELLADEKSRCTYADVINFRISGKIDYLNRCTCEKDEIFQDILHIGRDEVYIDMGAYNGDTVLEYADITGGGYKQIYALEPDSVNFRRLTKNTAPLKRIELCNAAAWNVNTVLEFADRSGRQSGLAAQTGIRPSKVKQVAAITGDSLCSDADYIKMDVEGVEKQAIEGCRHSLQNGAKLAAALYHRNEDIFELPLAVHEINPKLRLYVRHLLYIPAWETNLYAVPD